MDPFGTDPFEDIFKSLFGRGFRDEDAEEEIISGEVEDRTIDYINDGDRVYLVFELFGYSKEDVTVEVWGRELYIKAKTRAKESTEDYIANKLASGLEIKKILPKNVRIKTLKKTFSNGILEVSFEVK